MGHDIGPECKEPDDFLDRLKGLRGTCETGAAFAWRLIRAQVPDAKFAVILRDPEQVDASLSQFGLMGYGIELRQRYAHLLEISNQPGVFTCTFDLLQERSVCAALYRHCLDGELDPLWWKQLDPLNIQVDMGRRVQRLADNHQRIEGLKAQVNEQMARV